MGILLKPFKVFSGAGKYFVRIKALSEENLSLRQRVAALSVELARTRDIALENKRLKTLSDFKGELPYKTVIAKVIARDPVDWRSGLIIDKGKKHGIKEHMPCATKDGLIGSVIEVGPAFSKIMLITDAASRVGVVLKDSRESGVLIGSPIGKCRVIYLGLDSDITLGETVTTAGFSAFFPKGLAVGKVEKVGADNARLYKYAVLALFQDMGKIEEVLCIDTGNR